MFPVMTVKHQSLPCRYVDPVMATGWHMLLGGLPLMALSIAKEGSELGPRLQQLTGEQIALQNT